MKIISEDVKNFIIQNYTNLSIKEIREITNVSQGTITKIAKNNNIILKSAKKYSCDENYFNKIDSNDKAYWLGFLYADGYVRMKKGRSAELRLKLSKKDKEHVELFKKCIKSTHPIKESESVVKYKDDKISKSLCSFISIFNKKIVSDLFKNGCVNKKSLIIRFPDIKASYIRHFIRGYFDGDGCIYANKSYMLSLISVSKEFLEEIKSIFSNKLKIKTNISTYKNKHKLYVCNKDDIYKIYRYFYKDSKIFLYRKKCFFDNIF